MSSQIVVIGEDPAEQAKHDLRKFSDEEYHENRKNQVRWSIHLFSLCSTRANFHFGLFVLFDIAKYHEGEIDHRGAWNQFENDSIQ